MGRYNNGLYGTWSSGASCRLPSRVAGIRKREKQMGSLSGSAQAFLAENRLTVIMLSSSP